jgi:hypothetical protein
LLGKRIWQREFRLRLVAEARYDHGAMQLRVLGVTALVTVLDWAVWDWASSNGHDTVGLVAGVVLVPAALGLLGLAAVLVAGAVRDAAERAAERRRATDAPAPPALPGGELDAIASAPLSRSRIAA